MAITLNGTTGIVTPKLDALDLELGSKNVVERGSNANGEYVRFADGTQICMKRDAFSTPGVTNPAGAALYSTNESAWNYPAAFQAGTAFLIATRETFGGAWCAAGSAANTATTGYSVLMWSSSIAVPVSWDGITVGRWY